MTGKSKNVTKMKTQIILAIILLLETIMIAIACSTGIGTPLLFKGLLILFIGTAAVALTPNNIKEL